MTIYRAYQEFRRVCQHCNHDKCAECEVEVAINLLLVHLKDEQVSCLDEAIMEFNDYGLFDKETPFRIRIALEWMVDTIRSYDERKDG